MRDQNQNSQKQQEQIDRNLQNPGYEQTGSSQQQQKKDQRDQQQSPERGGVGEQSERQSTDKSRLSDTESI